jgi:dihydrofolate reductase
MRAAAGKDTWLFGGGSLFQSLLDVGLVAMGASRSR